jgi:hypothetical protein
VVSFFVYYRVVPERAPFARSQVQQLQDRLVQATGIRGRLMTKHGEPNLWMEVYEQVADSDAFERALKAAVDEFRLDELLVAGSRRHMECFECA